MDMPQLVHELFPQLRPALFKNLCSCGKLDRGECVPDPSAAHKGHQGNQFDGAFGEAVNQPLLVAWIGSACEQSTRGETLQAIGQNVGGNAFRAVLEKRSKAASATAEHRVTQDDEAPPISKGFQGQIDRASRAF
jgi:hypothetical protein